jgi:Polysaccharide pyruvyl transferase
MELHTPVLAEAENAETIQFFDSGGRPVPDQFFTRKFASGAPFHRIEQYRGSAKLAQVNHYCIRGSGPFRRKQARGNGYVRADGSDPDRNIQLQHQQDSFYQRMNANDVVDRAVLRHAFRTYRSTEAISEVVAGSIGEQTAQTSPPVSLYWYDKTPNFGDLLGPLLVGAVTGRDVVASKSDDDKQIASIGSVVSMVRPGGAIIWGSGLIRPPDKSLTRQIRKRLPLDVRAVRGKLTAEVLRDQFGVRVPNIFGDPALLFPRFFPFADQRQDGTIVVCPHYSHLGFFPGNAAIEGIKLKVLDVTTDALSVVKKIAGASYCISSSLHGVVIAQAYGVPWVWLRLEDIVLTGDRFKFEDFFSILDRDQVAEVSVASSAVTKDALLDWCKLAWLPDCAPVCDALLENFPYDAVPHRAIPGNEAWLEG